MHAPPQQAHLEHAGHDNPGRGPLGGGDGVLLRQDEHQHHQIEQGGGEGRDDEPAVGIQHPGQVGVDGHARQVGHGDLGQQHRQLELDRIVRVARIDDVHQPRHGQLGDDGDADGHRGEARHGLLSQLVGGRLAVLMQGADIGRLEGRGEGALAEDPSEQVGEGQGGIEGVGRRGGAGPHPVGNRQITQEAGEAADQGQAGIDHRRADQA